MKARILMIITLVLFAGACGTCMNEERQETMPEKVIRCWTGTVFLVTEEGGRGSGSHLGNGYILTAAHVPGELEELTILISGESKAELELKAKLVYKDINKDLALFKIEEGYEGIPVLKVAKNSAKIGDIVYAIGYQFGYLTLKTSNRGVVSGGFFRGEGEDRREFVLYDAAINRGCSGGPVLNSNMEVLSVNQQIFNDYAPMFVGISCSGSLGDLKEFLKASGFGVRK